MTNQKLGLRGRKLKQDLENLEHTAKIMSRHNPVAVCEVASALAEARLSLQEYLSDPHEMALDLIYSGEKICIP